LLARFLLNIPSRSRHFRLRDKEAELGEDRISPKKEEKEMNEDKKTTTKESQKFGEGMPFADMMRKIMGQKGVGSPCPEMIKMIMGAEKEGCRKHCAEMMQKISQLGGAKEERKI